MYILFHFDNRHAATSCDFSSYANYNTPQKICLLRCVNVVLIDWSNFRTLDSQASDSKTSCV